MASLKKRPEYLNNSQLSSKKNSEQMQRYLIRRSRTGLNILLKASNHGAFHKITRER